VRGRRHGERNDRRAHLTSIGALEGLRGRRLPGGELTIEPRESLIADEALHAAASESDTGIAHPVWFVIASLRGLGISVDELCELAGKRDRDTLLYGSVELEQTRPLLVGGTYRTTAEIVDVARKTTRDGSTLDSVVVFVEVHDEIGEPCGSVTGTYLFKRGAQ
jgi:hypothetical protein